MGKTLKFGGGVWATKKGSTLAYNDEDGNFKPLPFTYTGAGKGTRVNKEGLIEVVENDRPRIDYTDSEDGVFLLEKAATNLFPYSNKFDTDWNLNNITTTNEQIGVGGSSDAWKITASSGSGEKKLNKKIEATVEIDQSILGGSVITVGDTVIDASVKGQLESLAFSMKA